VWRKIGALTKSQRVFGPGDFFAKMLSMRAARGRRNIYGAKLAVRKGHLELRLDNLDRI
jgi:hypothetical protein